MASFSERFGHSTPPLPLTETSFPQSLRNGLWNLCRIYCFSDIADEYNSYIYSKAFDALSIRLWHDFFRLPLDERPERPQDSVLKIRSFFFQAEFNEVYDFIEFLLRVYPGKRDRSLFEVAINRVLERELAAYRLLDAVFVSIIEATEIESIIESSESMVDGVRKHIRRSAELLSDRNAPDYRNSIKEAISAVEAAVAFVSGKKTGGVSKPLRAVLDDLVLHPSLRDGFEKIYAYTNDAGGIRHAIMKDGTEPTQSDAKYMLVACSAFANYLIELKSKR